MLPAVTTLSEQQAKKLREERDEYKREYEVADAEITNLRTQLQEISNLKDKAEVAEIHRKYSSDFEVFDALVKAAHEATASLPSVVTEALYYSTQQKDFFPRREDWQEEEPEKAVEQKLLSGDGGEFWPNQNHPKIERALTALGDLQKFVSAPPEEFAEKYQVKYDDVFDMTSRPFWNRHRLF